MILRQLLARIFRRDGDPAATDADLLQRGIHLQSAGDVSGAEADYRNALAVNPTSADAQFLLGSLLGEKDHLDDAERYLRQALSSRPGFADAQTALGNIHLLRRNNAAAKACYSAAIVLDPTNVVAHSNLGLACQVLGDHVGALAAFEHAFELAPRLPGLIRNLTNERLMLEQYAQSESHLLQLLTTRADDYEVILSLADTLQKTHRPQAALEYYKRVQTRNSPDPDLLKKLGIAFQDLGRLEEAFDCYSGAIVAKPGFELARWHRTLCCLLRHDFSRGWVDYDLRLLSTDQPPRPTAYPVWQGGETTRLRLLIYGEQGLGDEIMFASCLPEMIAASQHCVVECADKLLPLFQRSFPAADVRVTPISEELAIDAQIAMGSLPQYVRRNASDFPRHDGYLQADPARIATWRERLNALGPGPKVGISWQGGTYTTRAPLRSIPLAQWAPLLALNGIHFIDMQYTDCAVEIVLVERSLGVRIHRWDVAREDFEETAALVAALDLVVSVCTTVIHLAGALGKPVWVMTPFSPEWRYGYSGEAMPWYPSARLFRQPAYGQWQPVIADVAQSLSTWRDRQTDTHNPRTLNRPIP